MVLVITTRASMLGDNRSRSVVFAIKLNGNSPVFGSAGGFCCGCESCLWGVVRPAARPRKRRRICSSRWCSRREMYGSVVRLFPLGMRQSAWLPFASCGRVCDDPRYSLLPV